MDLILCAHDDWSHHLGVRAILVIVGCMFLIYWQTLEIVSMSFDLRDSWIWILGWNMDLCLRVYSYVVF